MKQYLPIIAFVAIAVLIWAAGIVHETRAKNVSARWIIRFTLTCLVAGVIFSLRTLFQSLPWIAHKDSFQIAISTLVYLTDPPIGTILYGFRWDFLLALFPATAAIVTSIRARNPRRKTLYSTIATYISFAILDLLRPLRILPDAPTWYLLVSDLLLAPVFGVTIVFLNRLLNQFHPPKILRQWFRKHWLAVSTVCICICTIYIVSIPVSSRVYVDLTDWERITLRYLLADSRLNFYSVLGQLFGFSPLPQRAQWIFASTKDKVIELTVSKYPEDKVKSIHLEVYRIDTDVPPRIWYLIPKSERDLMRSPPRLIFTGEIFPGSMKLREPSLNCWFYNQEQSAKDPDSNSFSINAPLSTPITISREAGALDEAKPPLSDQAPSNTVFNVQASGKPISFVFAGAPINIFCHGSNSSEQWSEAVLITAEGLPALMWMDPESGTPKANDKPLTKAKDKPIISYPGFLLRIGKQNQRVSVWSDNSEVTLKVATPVFNLGHSIISDFDAKGLRGTLKIGTNTRALDSGDELSIGGQTLTISGGTQGQVVVEGEATKISHNRIDESKRVWAQIPSEIKSIIISVLTSLLTTLVVWSFKR